MGYALLNAMIPWRKVEVGFVSKPFLIVPSETHVLVMKYLQCSIQGHMTHVARGHR